jgi:hypothetical protein
MIADTPRTFEFRYATTYRFNGIEIVIVAKSMSELRTAWNMITPPDLVMDVMKVNEVSIKRA